jgi:DNA-binding MarR family transcriptional regulator
MALPKANKQLVSKQIDDLYLTLDEFRKVHPNMTPNAMMAFLTIATNPGISVREVQKKLIVPSSSAVRAVSLLSSTHRPGQGGGGLDLIRYDDDITDRRVKHLYLKEKGERLWSTIKRILNVKEH